MAIKDFFEQIDRNEFLKPTPQTGAHPDVNQANLKETLRDPEFIDTIRRFHREEFGEEFGTDEDALRGFLDSRRWKNLNSFGQVVDTYRAHAMPTSRARDLARLQQVYDQMPMFTDIDGDRSLTAAAKIAPKLIFDPLALLPVGQAGRAAAGAVAAGKKILGSVSRAAALAGAKKGAAVDAAINAGIGFGSDALIQSRDKEIGLQKEYSGTQAIASTLTGGALGGLIGGASGAFVGARTPKKISDLALALQNFTRSVDPSVLAREIYDGVDIAAKYNLTDADIKKAQEAINKEASSVGIDPFKLSPYDVGTVAQRSIQEGAISHTAGESPAQNNLMDTPAKKDVASAIAENGKPPLTEPLLASTTQALDHTSANLRSHLEENLKRIADESGIAAPSRVLSDDPAVRFKDKEKTEAIKLHEDLTHQLEVVDRLRRWPEERALILDELSSIASQASKEGAKVPDFTLQREIDFKSKLRNGDDEFNAVKSAIEKGRGTPAVEDLAESFAAKPRETVQPTTEQPKTAADAAATEAKYQSLDDMLDASADDLAAEYTVAREAKSPPEYLRRLVDG